MSDSRQESKLIRNLGFWDLMAIAIGQIIGAGIMSSTGVAIGMTGTGVVLAFLISPILTIFSIFPTAILGATVPATGGSYRYCSRILGKTPGMLYLLLYVTMNVNIAQFALSFASYFVSIVSGLNQHMVAIVILTLFFIANLIGTKSAAILNSIMTIALIGGLLLFIVFGLPKADLAYIFNPDHLFVNGAFPFVSTLALLSSATAGAQVIAELGGETKNPGRTIPRVMIISTFAVGIVYVLIAIVAAGVLPMEVVADQPLSLVARETMPGVFFYIFVIGAALGATATTLNATFSWVTKPLLVACDDGMLPKSLATVSKRGVPYKLLTFFYLVGLIPLVMGFDLAFITKFTTANSLLTKLMICMALFVLVSRSGDVLKKSSMKISPKQAKVISAVGCIILCVLSSSLLLNLSAATLGFLAALVVIVIVYTKTVTKNVVLENDLEVDYTTGKADEDNT